VVVVAVGAWSHLREPVGHLLERRQVETRLAREVRHVRDRSGWQRPVQESRRALPAAEPGAAKLRERLGGLVGFTHRFDHAVDIVARLDSADIGRLFDLLDRIPVSQLESLVRTIATMPPDDAVAAAELLAGLSPAGIGRLVGMSRQPAVVRVLGITLGRPRSAEP